MSDNPELTELTMYLDTINKFLKEIPHLEANQYDVHDVYKFIDVTPLPVVFECKLLQKKFLREIFLKKGKLMHLFHEINKFMSGPDSTQDQINAFITIAPIYPLLYLSFDIPHLIKAFVHECLENANKIPSKEELTEILKSLPVKSGKGYERTPKVTFGSEEHQSPCQYRKQQFIDEEVNLKKLRSSYRRQIEKAQRPGWDYEMTALPYFDE